MKNIVLTHAPIAKAEMLIRRPVAEVFEAFINPAITTKFWFSKSSGRLEEGKTVQWTWEMFGMTDDVHVKAIEANKRILIEWGESGAVLTTVEWVFTAPTNNSTFVSITNSGFQGDGDEVVAQVLDSTGGFTLVLAGLKSLLEHGIVLDIMDKFSDKAKNK